MDNHFDRSVVDYYERSLARHGPTARGMDWRDQQSQHLRFELLAKVGDLDQRSIHDLGCGVGHLLDYFASSGIRPTYTGSDSSLAMVKAARQRHPEHRFEHRDLIRDPSTERWDYVLSSGVFNVKLDIPEASWELFIQEMLQRMFERCEVAIAFNLINDRVDFRRDRLYYAATEQWLNFCRSRLSSQVVVRSDPRLYEDTFYVHR